VAPDASPPSVVDLTVADTFPIDLDAIKAVTLDPAARSLTNEQRAALTSNIQLCREAVTFFTALAGAKGLSGHSGGAFDTLPEVMIIRAFIAGGAPIVPIFFDEAGHRVATQYLLSVLDGHMPAEKLLHYREFGHGLPGHPEKELTPGVQFSSGRLGHLWAFCNGVAMANPRKAVVLLTSDGSQMEGDDAEAARLAVAKNLNIKVLIDDNNVTISGHPQEYMARFDLTRTLTGYGLVPETVMGEDLDELFVVLGRAFTTSRPQAIVVKRRMAPAVSGAEGDAHAHETFKTDVAIGYLEQHGREAAVELLRSAKPVKSPLKYEGSAGASKNRDESPRSSLALACARHIEGTRGRPPRTCGAAAQPRPAVRHGPRRRFLRGAGGCRDSRSSRALDGRGAPGWASGWAATVDSAAGGASASHP
jgi:transketolase N-terminal domain/subunit